MTKKLPVIGKTERPSGICFQFQLKSTSSERELSNYQFLMNIIFHT